MIFTDSSSSSSSSSSFENTNLTNHSFEILHVYKQISVRSFLLTLLLLEKMMIICPDNTLYAYVKTGKPCEQLT